MAGNVGVILAGGRSSRMGQNKAGLILAGEPLVARLARRISAVVDDLLVIGPPSLAQLAPEVRIVGDALPAMGPLGGLYTALTVTASARIFLVACDMPFVRPGLARAMLALAETRDEADVVVLQTDRRVQPMHAVYSRRCQPFVEQALSTNDHSLHSLLAQLSVITIDKEIVHREDPNGISAFNVNTPADWERALGLAADDRSSDNANDDQ